MTEKDNLRDWHAQHDAWAKAQLHGVPVEQLAWDREAAKDAAVAYEAGLEAGLRQGYRAGMSMGMANGLAAVERMSVPTGTETP